jgi:hypothetical protein
MAELRRASQAGLVRSNKASPRYHFRFFGSTDWSPTSAHAARGFQQCRLPQSAFTTSSGFHDWSKNGLPGP